MEVKFARFLRDESGAVTVDWVVLTAAIVGLGILVVGQVWGSSASLAKDIGTRINGVTVGYAAN